MTNPAGSSRVVELGQISLPTGVIVASDPFFAGSAIPFDLSVDPGVYSVKLRLEDLGSAGTRVASARLYFGPGSSAQVEPGEPIISLGNLYAVDSGLGAFMDESTRRLFVAEMAAFNQSHPDGNFYGDVLATKFRNNALDASNPDDAGLWALHEVGGSGHTVAMFASGTGDGAYPTVWALNRHGEPLYVHTEFLESEPNLDPWL